MSTLDIKFSIWERIKFENQKQMLDVIEKLKSGELRTGLDVIDYLEVYSEPLYDTLEELYTQDNNGLATLEILNEQGDTIWHNGVEELDKIN